MKKIVLLVICIMIISQTVAFASFTDVAQGHWAETYINKLSENGVISGIGDGTFAPDSTLTKGQFLKLIITASLPELDISKVNVRFNHWAAGYVKVAENWQVVDAREISPTNIDEPISRLDVIKILSKCDFKIRNAEQTLETYLPFSDVDSLTDEERRLLVHAVSNGIINGYSDGTFKPENNLTRAEASKILYIYMYGGAE